MAISKQFESLYHSWNRLFNRCYNEKSWDYKYYGGKGIRVCDEWKDWFNFKEWALDNGYEDNLSIDKIDVNGDYEPQNCRWVDMKEQTNNKTNNKYITYNGKTQSLAKWCEELGLNYDRTKQRINACGMTPEQAFELPKYYTQKCCNNKVSQRDINI